MITTLKTCFKCGAEKPLAEFYKHPKMADGHVNKCKGCNKKDVILNRLSKIEYYREFDRDRGSRRTAEDTRNYRKRFPNKYKAHCILNNAVRDGKIIPKNICELCHSMFNVVGHHANYSEPLNVVWLCQACHIAWHKENGPGLNG